MFQRGEQRDGLPGSAVCGFQCCSFREHRYFGHFVADVMAWVTGDNNKGRVLNAEHLGSGVHHHARQEINTQLFGQRFQSRGAVRFAQPQQVAAFFNIGQQLVHLTREQGAARACQYQQVGVGWHF